MAQQTMKKDQIFIVNPEAVPPEDLAKKGANKTKVQYLVDERHGSDRFALRLYTVEKGGHTPLDQHEYEHQVYILKGSGLLRGGNEGVPVLKSLREGDTVFIPSRAMHQFINESDDPLVFLCVKGNPSLYTPGSETAQEASGAC